ncbi:hypothetical protein FJTKL_13328 [Diaporthe vaccinii]|uniref:Ubiquitin-like domain-containing protein n=1 Tax=Diaporthe vaccinii TaxID=105482 RepID=A0ABR4EB35_9PEZI
MANVIILSYDEGGYLVPKPADYDHLIDIARTKFPDLYGVDNDSITFHFTPEWFDSEVKLDRDAFAEVHNRAVLRITTTASAPAQGWGNDGNIQAGGLADPRSDYVPYAMEICVIHVPTDRKVWVQPKTRASFSRLMSVAARYFGVNRYDHRFYYQGEVLPDYDTPESMAMEDGDLIEMHSEF